MPHKYRMIVLCFVKLAFLIIGNIPAVQLPTILKPNDLIERRVVGVFPVLLMGDIRLRTTRGTLSEKDLLRFLPCICPCSLLTFLSLFFLPLFVFFPTCFLPSSSVVFLVFCIQGCLYCTDGIVTQCGKKLEVAKSCSVGRYIS